MKVSGGWFKQKALKLFVGITTASGFYFITEAKDI